MTAPERPTKERLEELRAALKAGTPGPWSTEDASTYDAGTNIEIGAKGGLYVASVLYDAAFVNPSEHARGRADAALIVAAVNALSSLLAEIDALTEELAAADEVCAFAGLVVQRIDENPNDECPFCPLIIHPDGGADHEEDCPVADLSRKLATRASLARSRSLRGGG